VLKKINLKLRGGKIMPSAKDFFNVIKDVRNNTADVRDRLDDVKGKLDTANNHLGTIEGKLDTINSSVRAVENSVKKAQQILLWGFQQLITLGHYTNQALFHNNQQNDTMICLLQHIAIHTCGSWNEAHIQTGLQEEIKVAMRKLADLYAATHGDTAQTLQREEELRREIEACCPPPPPEPACVERPCPMPGPFAVIPPGTEPPPPREPTPEG
jgi:hypothetical protein